MSDLETSPLHTSIPLVQIQLQAAKLISGLTGSQEGVYQLSFKHEKLLPALFRLIPEIEIISREALVSLVNLSQEPTIQASLLDFNAVPRAIDYIREKTCPWSNDLLIMLLANLTSDEKGAAAILGLGRGIAEGLSMAMLLNLFVAPAPSTDKDAYAHVATILPNVTRIYVGRKLLLQPGRGLLGVIASQLRSKSELRRRGCAMTIKNVFFSAEEDGTIEDITLETDSLGKILDACCGITAEKEEDDAVREVLAEAILCLAMTDEGRKVLWQCKAPELLQKGYELEENRAVCELMERTAEMFLGDGFQPDEDVKGGPLEMKGP